MKSRENIRLLVSLAIVLCVLATSVFGTVFSLVHTKETIPNSGRMKALGVGIYWDSACTNRTISISWGLLEPGSNRTVTVYVRNEGKAAITLAEAIQNWNPSTAASYMTLAWNYASQTISMNQVLQVKLTLVVSPTISGISSFTFNLMITATG